MSLKTKLAHWLVPELTDEICRLRWLTEGIYDIQAIGLPLNDFSRETAFQNARNFENGLISGETTIQDRRNSLLEIYTRSNND